MGVEPGGAADPVARRLEVAVPAILVTNTRPPVNAYVSRSYLSVNPMTAKRPGNLIDRAQAWRVLRAPSTLRGEVHPAARRVEGDTGQLGHRVPLAGTERKRDTLRSRSITPMS
jgi:hypothetical protein